MTLTLKQAQTRYPDMVKNQFWTGTEKKYLFRCTKHGHYYQFFDNHKKHPKCPKCSWKIMADRYRLTIEKAEQRCPNMVKGQTWTTARAKYWFLCQKHGKYQQAFSHQQKDQRCQKCSWKKTGDTCRLPLEKAEKRYPDMVKGQKWITARSVYLFLCPSHGEYKQNFNDHHSGKRCSKCNRSHGENNLKHIATILGIADYEEQKRFPDCRNVRSLPFDGASESLRTLFEFHGIQHYHPVKRFGGTKSLRQVQKHDRIKRSWALRNGWNLIVIPYRIRSLAQYVQRRILTGEPACSTSQAV